MALNKESSEEIMTYHADSVDTQSLKKDIEELFTIIVDQSIYTHGDVLIFIDATNGHISFTPYDHNNLETIDGTDLWVLLHELYEGNTDSSVFDDITTSAVRLAVQTSSGQKLKRQCNLFLQTELDDPVQL